MKTFLVVWLVVADLSEPRKLSVYELINILLSLIHTLNSLRLFLLLHRRKFYQAHRCRKLALLEEFFHQLKLQELLLLDNRPKAVCRTGFEMGTDFFAEKRDFEV
jgi:hypothetical protein